MSATLQLSELNLGHNTAPTFYSTFKECDG